MWHTVYNVYISHSRAVAQRKMKMSTVRDEILNKLQGTKTLAAFESGGESEFQYYWNYARYNEYSQKAHFAKLGIPESNSTHDTHNAYCAWGTRR